MIRIRKVPLKMLNVYEYELGYTPSNLKKIRAKYSLTQQDVADITESKWRSVARWEADIASENRSDMPHKKWVALLEYCKTACTDK